MIFLSGLRREKTNLGTMRRNEKMTVTDHAMLYSVKITNVPDCDDYSNAFEIQFSKKKYLICTATPREKLEWLQALKEQIMNIHQKDAPREKGSYIKASGERIVPPSPVSAIVNKPVQATVAPVTSPNPISAAVAPSTPNTPLQPTPATQQTPSASPASSSKIKCYLDKGTKQQRIRKISLSGVRSVEVLLQSIRKEFEWPANTPILVSYLDEDGDAIEISTSTSIDDIVEEAKSFLLTKI